MPARSWLRTALPLVVTGFGLGAFLDGIVLHQVLQWHHLVVEYQPIEDLDDLQVNTFWDGVFHLAAWGVVLVGLLWTVRRRSAVRDLAVPAVAGALLVGWGAFNVTDQIVFHLLLEAHHIRMVEDPRLYDWGYTALGAVLIAVGLRLGRRGSRRSAGRADVSRGTSSSG